MMNSEFKHRKRFFMFPLVALAFILGGGAAVMILWNAILPTVIPAVGMLTYIQAIGLLILCRILFGGFRGRGGYGPGFKGGPPWRQKIMNMTEEEREKFRNEWKERCAKK
jgi:hypothetical protein